MAKIKCKQCNKRYNDEEFFCPKCGINTYQNIRKISSEQLINIDTSYRAEHTSETESSYDSFTSEDQRTQSKKSIGKAVGKIISTGILIVVLAAIVYQGIQLVLTYMGADVEIEYISHEIEETFVVHNAEIQVLDMVIHDHEEIGQNSQPGSQLVAVEYYRVADGDSPGYEEYGEIYLGINGGESYYSASSDRVLSELLYGDSVRSTDYSSVFYKTDGEPSVFFFVVKEGITDATLFIEEKELKGVVPRVVKLHSIELSVESGER